MIGTFNADNTAEVWYVRRRRQVEIEIYVGGGSFDGTESERRGVAAVLGFG